MSRLSEPEHLLNAVKDRIKYSYYLLLVYSSLGKQFKIRKMWGIKEQEE